MHLNCVFCDLKLASSMLSLFDPTIESEEKLTDDQLKLIPNYRSPKIQGAVLPGRPLNVQTRSD